MRIIISRLNNNTRYFADGFAMLSEHRRRRQEGYTKNKFQTRSKVNNISAVVDKAQSSVLVSGGNKGLVDLEQDTVSGLHLSRHEFFHEIVE